MTDRDVEDLGRRYAEFVADGQQLRGEVEAALDACHRGEVDPAFGRELVAALGNLEACPAF